MLKGERIIEKIDDLEDDSNEIRKNVVLFRHGILCYSHVGKLVRAVETNDPRL